MALDNAALLEVLEAMQAAGVEDRVRTAAQTIYQALIDAELTAVIGAGPWERTDGSHRAAQRESSAEGDQEMVAAAIRTIFAQPDAEHVTEQFEVIATMLGRPFPKVAQMLREARDEVLAFTGFPGAHWTKVWSTNPLERLNKEGASGRGRRPRLPGSAR